MNNMDNYIDETNKKHEASYVNNEIEDPRVIIKLPRGLKIALKRMSEENYKCISTMAEELLTTQIKGYIDYKDSNNG